MPLFMQENLMRTAIISDVHSNLEALQTVLADIDNAGVDRIFCLGDTVGYGPQPRECLDIVRERCAVVLAGNHENAILHGASDFTQLAAEALEWTAARLQDAEIRKYLAKLPNRHIENEAIFVHGSIYDPINDYVREADSPWMFNQLINTLQNDFDGFSWCFVGHNHRAFLGTELGYIFPHDDVEPARMTFNLAGQKAYISVGAVGQPRDDDPRACWLLLDDAKVTYNRLEYDWKKTAKLINQSGLPKFLARRLLYGE